MRWLVVAPAPCRPWERREVQVGAAPHQHSPPPTCQHHHCTDIGTSKGRINTKYLKIDDKHGDNGCHRQMIFTDNKMQDNYINVFSLSRKF